MAPSGSGRRPGPEVSGPEVSGPEVSGPEASGPEATGPEATGPERAGPGTGPPQYLEAELAGARAALDDLRREFADLADPDVVALDDEHDSEGSTIGFERARVAGLILRTERRIGELEEAERRAAEGTYGVCEGCGGAIGAPRLAALPSTRRCVDCARRAV